VTLLFPPIWLVNIVALNNSATAPKIGIENLNTDKPLITETSSLTDNPTKEQQIEYLKFKFTEYKIEGKLDKAIITITNESGWDFNAIGDDGTSRGLLQYQKATWNENCLKFGKYEDLDPYAQISCMALMWSKNMENRWTAYRDINK
jgi:hypothetical protein